MRTFQKVGVNSKRTKRMTAMRRRIEVLETDANLHIAVIRGLQYQTNRDADVIDHFDKKRKAYETSRLCNVCRELYSGGDRTPHVLDCGHAVCRACFDRLVIPLARKYLQHNFQLPVCRGAVYAYPARNRTVFAMIPGALPIPPRD